MKEVKAIVYTSNTGFTAKYAELLGKKLNIPVYAAKEAKKSLTKGTEIIYMGWLMAGSVKDYPQAAKRYQVLALCGVGMAPGGAQDEEVRKKYKLEIPVFTLQGGYDHQRLTGIYKFMMNTMFRVIKKGMDKKEEISEQEKIMLDMIENGGDFVCEENLSAVLEWYRS